MNLKQKYIRRGIRTAARTFKNQTVVIILSLGKLGGKDYGLFVLENEGTFLWKLLEENRQIKEVIAALAKFKKISYAKAAPRLLAYIKKLARSHIVDIVNKPSIEYY